jgi:AraC family transcriptional regulator
MMQKATLITNRGFGQVHASRITDSSRRSQTKADHDSHRADTVQAYQKSVERVITQMKQHLAEPLDLDEIARIAAISKFHLVRVFDEITGTTPHHFLACLRVQRAKELLLNSSRSITEICLEVGYTSLGSFSKSFSALVGLSPQEFRELPRRMDAMQFARSIWKYLAARTKQRGAKFEGTVEGPRRPRGFIFVGTFTGGVPQGVPFSGTVLLSHGVFRIEQPPVTPFHVLAVLVPFSADLASIVTTIPVGLVASLRIQEPPKENSSIPRLHLRPLRLTDPPIVLALPALPPLRHLSPAR